MQTPEHVWRVAHIRDLVDRAEQRWEDQLTGFMPRSEAVAVLDVLALHGVHAYVSGGYNDAERVRICFRMLESSPNPADYGIAVLAYRGQTKFATITHRDCLGALMSLGIEREKFGDLFLRTDGFDVMVDVTLLSYLQQTPLRVRQVPMSCRPISLSDWQPPERNFDLKQVQVSSLRLDAVVAKVFHFSRAQAAEIIVAGKVQLNHRVVKAVDALCTEEDTLSVTGKGKCRIEKGITKTKKGKLQVTVAVYR